MSNSTFHGMLHRACTNGPMTAVAMQHRIDVLERSIKRHASKCDVHLNKKGMGRHLLPVFFGVSPLKYM